MATRGRPRLNERPMTSSERKKFWVIRMRNDGGIDPGQPSRRPVEIYLREEAREVLRQERKLAKDFGLPAQRDSKLIEDLLLWHASHADRSDRAGLSILELRRRLREKDAAIDAARADLVNHLEQPIKRNIRTLKHLLEAKRSEPSPTDLAQECKRRNNTASATMIDKLVSELRPLFAHPMGSSDFTSKVRRQIEAHIDRIFGFG